MPAQQKTLVVITGGTIESYYSPEKSTPYYVPLPDKAKDSVIPAALEKLQLSGDCDFFYVTMKDSKRATTTHLDRILDKIVTEHYEKVVIVHGTDTMPVHARYLQQKFEEYGTQYGMEKKRIIFTGAMEPLRDEHKAWRETSDGWENLRRALADARDAGLRPGVYVEMGQGPWEARSIKKQVITEGKDGQQKVKLSGFVPDDPNRHQEIPF